jgi:outer membrane protein insertion porin family
MDLNVYCDDEAHFQRWQAMELQPDEVLFPPQKPAEEPAAADQVDDESDDESPSPQPAPATAAEPIIFRGQSPQPTAAANSYWSPDRAQAWQVARPPANTYDQIRGQSPGGQPYVNQAYAQVPTTSQPQAAYGGQIVRPTGPENAPTQSSVQPAQYSSDGSWSPNLQPPAGSVYPQPLSPYGPLPGTSLDPTNPLYPTPNIPGFPERTVDVDISGSETQTGRLMLGLGVNSNAGIVGNIVIDERNFDWTRLPTSWEDVRNGSAWRGAGQRFTINASPGSQVSRYLVSFQEPYLFDRPLSLSLSGSYYNRLFTDWTEQRMGGRISLGKQWVERDLSAILTYRGDEVTIFNPSVPAGAVPQLDRALGSNVLHGFRASLINDTRDNAFLATQGHYLEIGGEQVIGSFSYPRVDLDFRQYWMLSERPDHSGRHVLSFATTVGYSGTQTPIYDNFFAGGFSTLRGFNFRGASPVVVVPGNRNVIVGGPFEWINSAQYLFPITADDMLHGVVFCDFGTVEPSVEIKNMRVAPGAGLRITVPAMGPAPIALDFAWAVNRADTDNPQVFSFSLGFSR